MYNDPSPVYTRSFTAYQATYTRACVHLVLERSLRGLRHLSRWEKNTSVRVAPLTSTTLPTDRLIKAIDPPRDGHGPLRHAVRKSEADEGCDASDVADCRSIGAKNSPRVQWLNLRLPLL
jgi:hypothetical protein